MKWAAILRRGGPPVSFLDGSGGWPCGDGATGEEPIDVALAKFDEVTQLHMADAAAGQVGVECPHGDSEFLRGLFAPENIRRYWCGICLHTNAGSVKKVLMSDFSLGKIAPFLEKDSRTLRRWCEGGIVPAAIAFRSGGGHWRIRGESVQSVVQAIQKRIPKTARRRKENAYPVGAKGFRDAGMTPRRAWLDCGEIEALMARHKRVAKLSGGSAYPIDTKPQKIAFLRAFFESAAESWHDGAEEYFAMYAARTGAYSDLPSGLRYWTPKRIAALVGWSRRSLYRHFPDWRARLRKRGLRHYKLFLEGESYLPGETWGASDRDSFYNKIDALLSRRDAA